MTSYDDLIKRSARLLTYHRKRIWWITSRVFILTLILTAFGMAFRPRYVARTTLTILPTRSEIGFASQRLEMWGMSPATLLGQTYSETLTSRTLAEDVARTLLIKDRAELSNGGVLGHVRTKVITPIIGFINQTWTLLNTGRWETPDPFTSLVGGIQSRTKVQNLPGSFVLQIAVTWENPKIAAAIANTLAERHVQMTLKSNREEMKTTREFIEARITESKGELAEMDKKIQDYRVREKLYATSSDLELGLQERSQSIRDLNATHVSRAQLDAKIAALKPFQTPTALAEIEAERTQLKIREEEDAKVIEEQIAKLDKVPAKEAGLIDLYRTRLSMERALSALQDRLLETKVSEAAQLSTARVIDVAIPPVYPEGPLLVRNAVASLVVGLLLSLAFVLMSEAWHPGLRSRDELGAEAGSMLGLVPYVAPNGHSEKDDPDAEKVGGVTELVKQMIHGQHSTVKHRRIAKRHLEHLLQRLTDGVGPRICLFVSLGGGEGKTYLIEHLARLAREAALKVLVIDANFGSPSLHRILGKSPAPGLSELLSGSAEARDLVVTAEGGIDLIGAGLKRLNPQAKWAIETVRLALGKLAEGYDLVLVDTAALRNDPSATRLLPLATDVVCVIDATKSRSSETGELKQRLAGSTARIGFVLNKKLHEGDLLFAAGTNGHAVKPLVAETARSRV